MTRHFRSALIAGGLIAACLTSATLGPALAAVQAPPVAAAVSAAAATATIPPNSISVSGSGDAHIAPDMATVAFGVLVNRDTADGAQAAANTVIADAVKNLHALGIPDRHIQTADLSLQPRFDNAGSVIIGYQASQTLAVQVYGLRLVGRVVDAGVSAHANDNVSIAYGLSNAAAARTAALTLAVQNARARAQAVAAAIGRSLAGAHVQVTESSSQPTPQPVVADGSVRAAPSKAAPATPSFGGTLTVHEDVTLTYTF